MIAVCIIITEHVHVAHMYAYYKYVVDQLDY